MSAAELDLVEPGIARILLNRPERLNAIDHDMIRAVEGLLGELERSADIRAVILTGAGRGFCAGADLHSHEIWDDDPASGSVSAGYRFQARFNDMFTRLYELPMPVIAAVNGAAVGGGLAFALHSDIRICARSARFGSAFIRAGLSSMDMGTSYLLPRIVGVGAARELMLTGRVIETEEAARLGLVTEVVEEDRLLDAALAKAREIAENNPFGVWQTKIGINAVLDAPGLRQAKATENLIQTLAGQTGNPAEAAAAFREHRRPAWPPS
jgi:enoyl-CoA hydratase/carnithine racemase